MKWKNVMLQIKRLFINNNIDMRLEEFIIPQECTRISIKTEDKKIIILFEPENPNVLFCEETGHTEEEPRIGQIAIMWGKRCREAIISRVEDIDFQDFTYKAKNEEWYDHAILFRDESQYNKILNYNDDEKTELSKVKIKKE